MDDAETEEDEGLEATSTVLDPQAMDSVFAISKSVFTLSESLLSATPDELPELIHDGLEDLRERLEADYVWMSELRADGPARTTYESTPEARDRHSELELSLGESDFDTLRTLLEEEGTQYFGPGEALPADARPARDVVEQHRSEDLALIPLLHHGELKAVFGVQRLEADRPLSTEVRTLLEGAAGVFLQALVIRDVETALEESQRRYQQLVDTIGEVIFEVDDNGCWTFLSNYWEQLTGASPREKLGCPMLDSFDEYDGTELEAALNGQLDEATSVEFDARLIEDGQQPRWVRLVVKPKHDSEGGFEGISGAIRDASRSRESVADLQQVDRLINFGTLAAGIGHELNNPLAFVLGNLDFASGTLRTVEQVIEAASRRHPDDHGLEEALDLIDDVGDATRDMKDGARRLRDIVSDLRVFTRVDSNGTAEPIDLREPLESAISIGFSEIRHRATLIREFGATLPAVEMQRGRISQVFLNLLINAAQAFGENSGDDDNRIWVRLHVEGEWVVAEVEDNGPGMDEEQRSRIFEAFYTTKEASEGTGLGLPICKNLVESAGGTIEVESEVGEGSVFRVRLPARPGEEPQLSEPSRSPSGGLPKLRVLVIDDEPAVSRTIQRMLGRKHQLTTVSDARIALEALRAGEEYDVILCDIIMPRINGEEFLNLVKEEFDGLDKHIIFMTGGASMSIVSRMRENASQSILDKPFTRRELRDACIALIRRLARTASTDD